MMTFRKIGNPRAFQSSIARNEFRKAAEELRSAMLDDFERTTATWEHKVKWESKVEVGASVGGIKVAVFTTDPIYKFIDKGTRVRYAVMSKDFKAKTEPNVILSTPGKGRRLFVSKKHPRPGIKARNFTKIIKRTQEKEFRKTVENAMRRFARRAHGG